LSSRNQERLIGNPGEVATYLRFREALCIDGWIRKLAYSEHSANLVEVGCNEANVVQSIGLHRRLPPDSALPSVQTPYSLHGYVGIIPVHEMERSWPLLSAQYVELYIDDVLIHARDIDSFLANVCKIFERLREFNVAVNPVKTKLGLAEVKYVGHVVSAPGTSFKEEKRLKVLKFPLPETQKNCCNLSDLLTSS
jgi:hypothetical protein